MVFNTVFELIDLLAIEIKGILLQSSGRPWLEESVGRGVGDGEGVEDAAAVGNATNPDQVETGAEVPAADHGAGVDPNALLQTGVATEDLKLFG